VARNFCGLALLLALAGCSTFSHKKEEQAAQAAEAKLATIRARTDSLRKARHLADSLEQVRQVACVDSVRTELGKLAALNTKPKSKKKKPKVAPLSAEMVLSQAQSVCGQGAALPAQTTVAAARPSAPDTAHSAAPAPASTPAKAPAPTDSTKRGVATATPTAPSAPEAVAAPNDSMVWADSVRKAKEIEMSRETFSYGGAARDPFSSLLNMAKNGPELADLQLVGIYQNLRSPSSSVAVFREKKGGKRYKLRAGDQVGRSRLVQIRDREVVFTIEDFGFERQETLSLRKQEDVIQ
jgi:hypothetical protein